MTPSHKPFLSLVVTGRNDDYGGGFARRVHRTLVHNLAALLRCGIQTELVFVEWNPLPDHVPLALSILEQHRHARAFIVSPECHARYSQSSSLSFHEMPAKNVGIRRSRGEWILVLNADVLLDDDVCARLASDTLRPHTLYRARRIDLAADTPWTARHDAAVHLPSGEGRLLAEPWLGAAGDFCLAHRSLWSRLRGFDERIRFSTRAKDWQFFLSAMARQVPIEFIGRVFHLDHEDGFQRTPAATRDSNAAHFGGPWDIEYGLPIRNAHDWGLADGMFVPDAQVANLTHISPATSFKPRRDDDRLRAVLGAPDDGSDEDTALLMHAIWHAAEHGCRVLADLDRDADLVKLAGLARVALEYGVDVHSRTPPPAFDGYADSKLPGWPLHAVSGDVVIRREGDRLTASLPSPTSVWPSRRRAEAPVFNPMLARRVLRAWLCMRRREIRRFRVFGAGSHTATLLRWGVPDALTLEGLVVTAPQSQHLLGLPVASLDSLLPDDNVALLLSSASYEGDMEEAARGRGWKHVVPLYAQAEFARDTHVVPIARAL